MSPRKIHYVPHADEMRQPFTIAACGREVDGVRDMRTHRGTVTCFKCQAKMPKPALTISTGIVPDAGGRWHVWSNGEEILTSDDREYALRALKRAIERELGP